jgi:16S rRNA (guanine527-N7)-methyltransferase
MAWGRSEWILLDSNRRRASFLRAAVEALGLSDRVKVLPERAELAGRGALRASVDLVVARSFGAPGVTAECASPFLRPGGRLLVAEPPGGVPGRWDERGLDQLGMRAIASCVAPTAFQVIVQQELCPNRYPRRTGIPTKRPLF